MRLLQQLLFPTRISATQQPESTTTSSRPRVSSTLNIKKKTHLLLYRFQFPAKLLPVPLRVMVCRSWHRQTRLDILQHLQLQVLHLSLLLLLQSSTKRRGPIRPVSGAASSAERVLCLSDAGCHDGLGPFGLLALCLDALGRRCLVLEVASPATPTPRVGMRVWCWSGDNCVLLRF